MQLIRGLHNLRPEHRGNAVTIGNFDGVHLGHRAMVAALKQRADALGVPALVMCFEPQPQEFFAEAAGRDAPARLMTWRDKVEALAEALKKAERPNRVQLAALTRPLADVAGAARSHISARTRKGVELIPLEQVIYFIADHKYVTLRHPEGEVLLDEPLKTLEDEFGERFVRIHRNALVARDRIERLQRTALGHFQLFLRGLNGEPLTVSRRHVAGVRKLMNHL